MPTSTFRRVRWLGWILGPGLALAAPVYAQFDTGQVSGIVRDEQGGVVPGATVTITNEATKLGRTYTTGPSGYYVAPALPPGAYEVAVALAGFKKFVKTGVKLDATAKVQVDAVLATGVMQDVVTVTAESTPLQTNTGQVAKTIEAKQIQELMLNGRNPLNLAALKPGVRGVSVASFNPDNLHVQVNINGSRGDENLVTVDGVPATRTRASGASVGIASVDALQEIQILTASYLPEYGRSGGGQIRLVTKSGGQEFHGDVFGFFRDDALDANSWSRNRNPDPKISGQPAPYGFYQWGYDLGGPLYIPGKFNTDKDKLFFFFGQEWIRYKQNQASSTVVVPSERMRRGDFSELLDPSNSFFGRAVVVRDPVTGEPFLNNVIPFNRLSPNGLALLNIYPLPTPGFQQGRNNWFGVIDALRRTRKDTLRLDLVPDGNNRFSFRGSLYHWKTVDPFRGDLPLARTDWNRPNESGSLSWTRTSSNVINEATVGFARDRVYIEVFRGTDAFLRSKYGVNYPYIFPERKEIPDKIPTVSISSFQTIDGGPYPAFSQGPIWIFSDNLTWIKGRHTFKGGVFIEHSGEDDFDQINVLGLPGDTNNQNGRFEFTDGRVGGTGLAIANAAMGLFTNYAEIGQRSRTDWRALAVDAFLQDGWKVRDNVTLEYGVRYAYWPPFYAKLNNIAMFHPDFYDRSRAVTVDPRTGAVLPGSGDRLNGIVLPGDGFPPEAKGKIEVADNPDYQRLFHGLPRGFSETHSTTLQPRFGMAWSINPKTVLRLGGGVFHNRLTLNDSTLLGGNPPIQWKVGVANGNVDNPTGGARNEFPLLMTMQDPVFKHPTAYNWSVSLQRQLPWDVAADVSYVGRVGTHLQRERNINQLQPGTTQANPGVNPNALRPYRGFSTIRLSENASRSEYNALQFNVERRFRGGLGFGVAYTLSRSEDNADSKRDTLYNSYSDGNYWGPSGHDRTHVLTFNYIYELPFWKEQKTLLEKILGGWQLSGVTFVESGSPFWVGTSDDIAGVGDTQRQPWDLVGGTKVADQKFSRGATLDQNFWFNPKAFAPPARGTFGNSGRNILRNPWTQGWDISLIKNVRLSDRGQRLQLRLEAFNFINHPNLGGADSNPRSGTFGRVTSKSGNRNVQLGVKLLF